MTEKDSKKELRPTSIFPPSSPGAVYGRGNAFCSFSIWGRFPRVKGGFFSGVFLFPPCWLTRYRDARACVALRDIKEKNNFLTKREEVTDF